MDVTAAKPGRAPVQNEQPSGDVRRYRITAPFGKHLRKENDVLVFYEGPHPNGDLRQGRSKNVITLTVEQATSDRFSHLRLVPVDDEGEAA